MSRRFPVPAWLSGPLNRSGRAWATLAGVAALGWAGCTGIVDTRSGAVAAGPRPAAVTGPRDAFVLLSGGGTPATNNYSQYLQARAIAEFFERECPPERSWVFFGAGNRPDAPPVLGDVRRELKHDGRLVESWLPGTLPRNRPATRENFLRALREEILPVVRSGGTLYLLIGDHGELAGPRDRRESAITLWQLKASRRRAGEWYTDDKELLGVAELRQVLAEGLGEGRVVFGMTQCHSGGFHELAVAKEMTPPREWFVGSPPVWAATGGPRLRLRAAGFTATDEASPAAGCDADPDPERWAGYERFLPEALLGFDLMTGAAKGAGVPSLAEAHERATLVDRTIDKPRSTSEHYLEAWARLIETRIARELRISPAVRQALLAYERAVDRGEVTADAPGLRERQAQFERFTVQLAADLPDVAALLRTANRAGLEAALRERGERGPARGRRGNLAEVRRAWSDTLRPAWKAAVLGGQVDARLGAALAFERRLLTLEDEGRDFLLPRGGSADALRNEIYWQSTYAEPAKFNRATAEAVSRWGAGRRAGIVDWAQTSADPQVRSAAGLVGPGPVFAGEPPRPLARRTAVERVLFYRRVLAAWEFLATLRAAAPLAELETLIALERQPVRTVRGSL
ncbi:MAG: hypothetical protein JNL92_20355 [Opitutaceae bacterium]|nr:hypothetical protein [Opitutaceae bacterium]